MSKFMDEFKTFINQGNVLDMAVGVIIGAAFKAIVDSLVNDIIMPILSIFTGGVDFTQWVIHIGESATLNYGNFISAVLNFLIMALVLFGIVKSFNKLRAVGKADKEKDS